jgi:hypothetical protein
MRRTVLFLSVVALVTAGCSGDKLAENVLERQIESESGGDVDIDFDDGDISIQTEDGKFSIETDEDGNISIESDDGQMSIDSDDGETVIESEDGTMVIGSSGGELPDDFPDDLPLPDDVSFDFNQTMSDPGGQTFIVGGNIDGDLGDVLDQYIAALEAAGYSQQQLMTTPDGSFFGYDNGTWTVGGSTSDNFEGGTAFVMTVTPSSGG